MAWTLASDIGSRLRELLGVLGCDPEKPSDVRSVAHRAGVRAAQIKMWLGEGQRPSKSRLEAWATREGWDVQMFAEGGPRPAEIVVNPPVNGSRTRGPGRRAEDIELRAAGLKKDAARLEVIGRLLKSYRDAGQPVPVDIVIEILTIIQANSLNGPLEHP